MCQTPPVGPGLATAAAPVFSNAICHDSSVNRRKPHNLNDSDGLWSQGPGSSGPLDHWNPWTLHDTVPFPALSLRLTRLSVLIAVAIVTALAWLNLVQLHQGMSVAMAAAAPMLAMNMPADGPWTAADAWVGFGMWVVMMAGMMSPSATPMFVQMAGAAEARGEKAALFSALVFAAGYFSVWMGFSAVATLTQWMFHDAAMLSPSMAAVSPRGAGIVLVIAGLYQLTPEKRACLVHCRNPIAFLTTAWQSGRRGALRMGIHHGLYCLGCCWALMAVMFAVGLMNLAWVAAISAVVLIEKAGWGGLTLSRVTGVALILVGGYIAL